MNLQRNKTHSCSNFCCLMFIFYPKNIWKTVSFLLALARKQIIVTHSIHFHIWCRLTSLPSVFMHPKGLLPTEKGKRKKRDNIWLRWCHVTLAHSYTVGNLLSRFSCHTLLIPKGFLLLMFFLLFWHKSKVRLRYRKATLKRVVGLYLLKLLNSPSYTNIAYKHRKQISHWFF